MRKRVNQLVTNSLTANCNGNLIKMGARMGTEGGLDRSGVAISARAAEDPEPPGCGAAEGSSGACACGWRGPGFPSGVFALRCGLVQRRRAGIAWPLLGLRWPLVQCAGFGFGLTSRSRQVPATPGAGGGFATCTQRYQRKHPGRSQGVFTSATHQITGRGAGCSACSRCRTCRRRWAIAPPCSRRRLPNLVASTRSISP
jgi:hypothetical protein